MKTFLKIFACLLLAANNLDAQSPSFEVFISNECYPTSRTFRFDIWLKKTGSGILEIANLQFGINVNADFRGAGNVTAVYVGGSSMFVASQSPSVPGQVTYTNSISPGIDRLNITARANPGCGNGTIVPDTGLQCMASGIRFGTFELTTSLPGWTTGEHPDLVFNFIPSWGYNFPLQTKVSYYPQPCPSTGHDATSHGIFYDAWNAGGSCSQNPVSPGCSQFVQTNINSLVKPLCAGGSGSFTMNNSFTGSLVNGQVRYSIDGVAYKVVLAAGSIASCAFTNVPGGIHFIKVERGTGYQNTFPFDGGVTQCTATFYFTMEAPRPVHAFVLVGAPVNCYGENGQLSVFASGGRGMYKYDGGDFFISNPDLLDVPAGTYSFVVSDQNNCPAFVTDPVFLPEPPEVGVDSMTVINSTCMNCADGSVSIHVDGGTGNHSIVLSETAFPYNSWSLADSLSHFYFYDLTPGEYVLNAYDAKGCSSDPVSISILSCRDSCMLTLNLKIFFEGFYVARDSMKPVVDPGDHPELFDSVTVDLRSLDSLHILQYSSTNVLSVHGDGSFYFSKDVAGSSYYVVIHHRNSIAVWNREPVSFDSPVVTIDFTTE